MTFPDPFTTGPNGCVVNGVPTLQCIPNILPNIITLAIVFAFILCLILIIYSGIKFITSGGDEKQVEGAKKTLTFSIAGLILVLASFFIVQFIGKQTGVTCINSFGFNTCQNARSSCPAQPPAGFCPTRTHPACSSSTNFSWTCERD